MQARDAVLLELVVARGHVAMEHLASIEGALDASIDGPTLLRTLVTERHLTAEQSDELLREASEIAGAYADSLPPGARIDDFEIVREIGRGGMGVVYEARQLSIGRRVALKMLGAAGGRQEHGALRFMREAKALGRLHHPGIVPVHTWGSHEGQLYFAMELVEGRPLSAIIRKGPLTPERAARVARDVALALVHAHDAELVHRDVKPANILLEEDDTPRLTDFGIAHDARGETLTVSNAILGTPAFIAPEQARGRPAAGHNDIYGLGAVLYAMLSGRAPYVGDSGSVLLRVLTEDPPRLHALKPGLPRDLVAICERAMEREPEHRYASARALADDLARFLEGEPPSLASSLASGLRSQARRLRRRHGRTLLWSAAILVLGAVAAAAWLARTSGPPATDASSEWGEPTLLTTRPGREVDPAVSRDGRRFYFASGPEGAWDVFVADNAPDSIPENLTAGNPGFDGQPAPSPVDERIAYVSERDGVFGVHVLSEDGGTSVRLADFGGNPDWSPDGRSLVFSSKPVFGPSRQLGQDLWILDVESGAMRSLGLGDASRPAWSPDGRWIAYQSHDAGQSDVWLVAADGGGEPRRITASNATDWDPAWAPDGRHLYFVSDRDGRATNVWRVPFNAARGRAAGEAQRVTEEIVVSVYGPRLSPLGTQLFFTRWDHFEELATLTLDPETLSPRGPLRTMVSDSRLTRFASAVGDPSRLLYVRGDQSDTLVLRSPEGTEKPVVLQEGLSRVFPRWSPDGQSIAYEGRIGDTTGIWILRLESGEIVPVRVDEGVDAKRPVWSPDAGSLAYALAGESAEIATLEGNTVARTRTLPPAPGDGGLFAPASWSPGGREIAGSTDAGIYVFEIESGRYRELCDFGGFPQWLPSGGHLLFTWQGRLWIVDREGRDPRVVFDPLPAKLSPWFSVSADGRTVFASKMSMRGDIWRLRRRES